MKYLLVLFLMLSVLYLNLYSQNPPCDPNNNSLTIGVNKLLYVPPITPSTPYDVIIGYLALDSVRHYTILKNVKEFINRQTLNDTIMTIMKYYYKMVDYDPIKFKLYKEFGDYCSCPSYFIEQDLMGKLYSLLPNSGDWLILGSSIIAQIRIVDTSTGISSNSEIHKRFMIAKAEVIDTIKGRVFPGCRQLNTKTSKETDALLIQSGQSSNGCLEFEYRLDWLRGDNDRDEIIMGNDGFPWPGMPKLIDSLGNPWVRKDMDFIVFLYFETICNTDNVSYWSIYPLATNSKTDRKSVV